MCKCKLLAAACITVLCLFFSSCADTFNEKNPDASSSLASMLGVNYGGSKADVYDEKNGSLNSRYSYDIWYFTSADETTRYTISWENFNAAYMAVAVSSEPTFTVSKRIVFQNDTSGTHQIDVDPKIKVYIKVEPYNNSYYNTGSYTLKVSAQTDSIKLYKYN